MRILNRWPLVGNVYRDINYSPFTLWRVTSLISKEGVPCLYWLTDINNGHRRVCNVVYINKYMRKFYEDT